MNKDLRATLSRRDESKAAIIVPLSESAFNAHTKGLIARLNSPALRGFIAQRPVE